MTKKQQKGLFITFEGIDGCGKTTQLNMVEKALKERKNSVEVISTRNPGGTEFGKALREILLHSNHQLTDMSELLLFITDRAHHMETVVRPGLESGKIILCDRYTDSTVAYQGYGRHLSIPVIEQLNTIATQGIKPDITFLLDGEPETLRKRIQQRGRSDRMEQEVLQFHQNVRDGFLKLATQNTERIILINALDNPECIHTSVMMLITQKLEQLETPENANI